MLGLLAWFAWIVSSVGFASGSFGEERLAYIYGRTLYIDFLSSRSNSPSLSLYTFAFALTFSTSRYLTDFVGFSSF
jgi:hypothetical protein